jgi:hypothetical protein
VTAERRRTAYLLNSVSSRSPAERRAGERVISLTYR